MKICKLILLLSASILFLNGCEKVNCNCDKEDNGSNFRLTSDYLKQTIWKGKIWYESKSEVVNKGYINIQFSTDKRGKYEFKLDDMDDRLIEDFQFRINDNLFLMTADEIGRYPRLSGDWLIKSQSKSKIVLVQDGFIEGGVSQHLELILVDE